MRPALLSALSGLALAQGGCTDRLDLGDNLHTDAGDCVPGTYSGAFSCAAGVLGALERAAQGTITFDVVPVVGTHGDVTGFSVPATPGIDGTALGGLVRATLLGTLDCPAGAIAGVLRQVTVTSGDIGAVATTEGEWKGTYRPGAADGGVPGFASGTMTFGGSGDAAAAQCTWSASLR